jgi:restriction endonuclease S subunit
MAWPMVALGELTTLARREVSPEPEASYTEIGVRSFFKGTFHRRTLTGSEFSWQKLFRVRAGDLIFSNLMAWEGAVAVARPTDEGCVGNHRMLTCEVRPDRALPAFILAFLRTDAGMRQITAASPGSIARNKTLSPSLMGRIQIPLPPLDVQQRIVDRLDAVEAKLRQVSRIREEASGEVRLLSERALATMVGSLALGEARPLGEVVEVVGGGTPARSVPAFWDGNIPWVTPKDMKTRIISDAQQRITNDGLNASPAKLLPQNSVLVVVRGMILARFVPIALLGVPATINQDMKALIARPPLSADFLLAWLIANERNLFERVGKSTHDTRKLESEHLLSLPVPTLSPAEQQSFVGALQGLRSRISTLEQAMATAISDTERVLPALLAEAFGKG